VEGGDSGDIWPGGGISFEDKSLKPSKECDQALIISLSYSSKTMNCLLKLSRIMAKALKERK
jgi:hypothetical protein